MMRPTPPPSDHRISERGCLGALGSGSCVASSDGTLGGVAEHLGGRVFDDEQLPVLLDHPRRWVAARMTAPAAMCGRLEGLRLPSLLLRVVPCLVRSARPSVWPSVTGVAGGRR